MSSQKLEAQRKLIKDMYKNVGCNTFLSSTLSMLKTPLGLVVDFDANLNLLHFDDGVLDIDTKEFRPTRADDYNTFTTGYPYMPDITDEDLRTQRRKLLDFYVKAIPLAEELTVLNTFLGYCLSGKTDIKKVCGVVCLVGFLATLVTPVPLRAVRQPVGHERG